MNKTFLLQIRTYITIVTFEAGGVPFQVGCDTEDKLVGDRTPTPCTDRGIDSFIWEEITCYKEGLNPSFEGRDFDYLLLSIFEFELE